MVAAAVRTSLVRRMSEAKESAKEDPEAAIKRYAEAIEWALENKELLRDEMVKRYVEHLRKLLDKRLQELEDMSDSGQSRLVMGGQA